MRLGNSIFGALVGCLLSCVARGDVARGRPHGTSILDKPEEPGFDLKMVWGCKAQVREAGGGWSGDNDVSAPQYADAFADECRTEP